MKLYKNDGSVIEVPDLHHTETAKRVAAKFNEMEDVSEVIDKAMLRFVRRNSHNLGVIVGEVASQRGIPIEQATQIVLQVSAIATSNSRFLNDQVRHEYMTEQCKKHEAEEFQPYPSPTPVVPETKA